MIRREVTPPDSAARWLLVPQVAHAALAADLAENWSRLDGGIQHPKDTVISAMRRHDDGWRPWDESPFVDQLTGRPLDFTEQATDTVNEIWSASIDALADLGPLAQLMAGEHFLALRGGSKTAKSPLGRVFMDKYRPQCEHWRAAATARLGLSVAQQNAAINQLAFFDAFSLWLCGKFRTEPGTLFTWQRSRLTISPHRRASADRASQAFHVVPWPFHRAEVELCVQGYSVPARHYQSAAELGAELISLKALAWKLRPPG